MPEPKKQSSPRKTGLRRSHLRLNLARAVNRKSPVKAFETAKKTPNLKLKSCKMCGVKPCKCEGKDQK
jgi:ribosomal protein L32